MYRNNELSSFSHKTLSTDVFITHGVKNREIYLKSKTEQH